MNVLLHNLHTQEKTLASIIALVVSLEKRKNWPFRKVEIFHKEIRITEQVTNEDLAQVRVHLLHAILEHIKIPLYKDEDFLKEHVKT